MMRIYILIIWLTVIFSAITWLFWNTGWKYNLPTPVPLNYHIVNTGSTIDMSRIVARQANKPLLLHFFNPDCPCSRFNIVHFKSLVKKYGDRVAFAVVVISNKNYTAKYISDRFDFPVPVLFDRSIATLCGVYSTPQAVIIDSDHKLYYRGNYNKSRYCSNPETNYAQLAIDSLLCHHYNQFFDKARTTSYGCSLPNCKR